MKAASLILSNCAALSLDDMLLQSKETLMTLTEHRHTPACLLAAPALPASLPGSASLHPPAQQIQC